MRKGVRGRMMYVCFGEVAKVLLGFECEAA